MSSASDAHSTAMTDLEARAKAIEQLTPAAVQSLLSFISAAKPGDLSDGEWEERVNVILNLLRRQTQDGKTQDAREEGASSLAGSLVNDGHRPPLQAGSAVPGLTEFLLEMAEKNPSKVLRLYAMQHLSLWYAKEGDPGKKRAMVGLLERLAGRPGEETAGCAVLMLGDMRRQTQDFKTQDARQEGAGALAGSEARVVTNAPTGDDGHVPSEEPHQPSATPSATSASPRFVSANDGVDWSGIDRVLAREGLRLIGDGKAGTDVRISAIHAAVDRRDAAPLPELRQIAADPALVSTLRKAAIHAIGQLGGAEDMALLESLPQEDGNLSLAVLPDTGDLRIFNRRWTLMNTDKSQ